MRYFLFQLNEETATEVLAHINSGGQELSLPFRNHRSEASPGDQVLLWVQGRDAFTFGQGSISGPETKEQHPKSYREPERGETPRPAFPVKFEGFLQRNVMRTELRSSPAFAQFPFRQANVHNPFELTRAQYDAVFDLAESDVQPSHG